MKVDVRDGEKGAWERILTIEVPAEELDEDYQAILEDYRTRAVLPGFRKGKVPTSVVEKQYGPTLQQETLDRVIGEAYRTAITERALEPISQAEVENVDYEPEADLTFRISFDVRPDIRIERVEGRGVARSRNAALAHVDSDIVLFADDDVELLCENYAVLRRIFAGDPSLSCVCGMTLDEAGRPRKRFGRHMSALHLWNVAKVGTPEIAVRRCRVVEHGIAFDERFGAGAEWPIGDEYIFLADLLRNRLSGRHVALPLAVHPRVSSGMDFDARSLETRRAVFRRAVGRLWFPLLVAFALKNWRRFPSVREGLSFVRL